MNGTKVNGTDISKFCPMTGFSVGKYSDPTTTELDACIQ